MNTSGASTAGAAYGPSTEGSDTEQPPKTLDEAIARADKAAADAKSAKDRADGAFTIADSNRTVLTNLKRDSDKVLQAYEAAHPQLTIDQQSFADFSENEKESLDDLLGAATGDVARVVADKVKADEDSATALDAATTALAAVEGGRATAEAGRKASADALDRLKQLAIAIGAEHAKLKAQRDDVAKARQAGQYALAYWLLTERGFDDVLAAAEAELIDPAALPTAMLEAAQALISAQRTEEAAVAAVAAASAALAEAERKDAEQRAKGEATLRAALVAIVPRPAPSN